MENDDAYSNAAHIANAKEYPPKWRAAAAKFRNTHKNAQLDISYGPSDRQKFDFFQPDAVSRGLMVFVHGGYWLDFGRSDWSHLATGCNANGWAVAIPSYDLCPKVRISEITQQIARAVTAASKLVSGPIALTGHSAGGHLVARMMDTMVLPDNVGRRLKNVVPISAVADLVPLIKTSMNESLGLDLEEAKAESPAHMTNRYDAAVTVWVGANERPVFLDQSRWLAQAWDAPLVIDKNRHHFDVIDSLEDAQSHLVKTLLE